MQHEPVGGTPLYRANPSGLAGAGNDAMGRDWWAQIDTVHILREQHRFGAPDADSQLLYRIVQLLWSEDELPTDDIEFIVDTLNKRYTGAAGLASLLTRSPKAIVLRNNARPALNLKLAKTHAVNSKKRVVMWRASDTSSHNQLLSTAIMTHLELQEPAKTGKMPTVMLFFEGCDYIFGPDNRCPDALWCNNNLASGVRLILHDNEPDDNLDKNVRMLKYSPKGIVVRPHGNAISDAYCDGDVVPKGCLIVVPRDATFKVALDTPRGRNQNPAPVAMLKFPIGHALHPQDDPASVGTTIDIKRTGFPLAMGYAVTDYFSQGMSFKDLPFLMDLRPPPDGHYKAGSLRVPITRPSSMKDVHLLAPLFTTPAERSALVQKLKAVLRPNPARNQEMERLRGLHAATQHAYDAAHLLGNPFP
jgi:hypothetical protein